MENQQLSARRKKEVQGMPQEHQMFLSGRFRLIHAQMSSQVISHPAGSATGAFRKYKITRIVYFTMRDNVILTDTIIAKLVTIGLTMLYDGGYVLDSTDPDYDAYLSSLLTLLSVYADSKTYENVGLKKEFENYGIEISPFECESESDLEELFQGAWSIVGPGLGITEFHEHKGQIQIIGASILMLIAKRLIAQSVKEWFHNRWQSLSNVMNKKFPVASMDTPVVENCVAFTTAISSKHTARGAIFKVYRALAVVQHGQYKELFQVICKQLAYTEMGHIFNIMIHIVEKNPDVLAFPELMGAERSCLEQAFEFLSEVPEGDRPFVKFLRSHEECDKIHSRRFTPFSIVARAIASIQNPSMKNFRVRDNEAAKALHAKTLLYMEQKSSIGPLNSAEAFGAMINPMAAKRLLSITSSITELRDEFEDVVIRPRV
ncbi:nucleoprotein [Hymenopteran arli-related virus OKIAV100]|uniref:Nucleoprotein n=1 Tax=Hymenopteran arli-related virus OKIAV100 TaxID=2792564 RepID=A0A7T0M3H6_9MONO|nr:nucleoprotein [Hymenopteran arli-related virus OKIAV100]